MLGILIVSSFFIQLSFLSHFGFAYLSSDNINPNISEKSSEKEIIFNNLALNTSRTIDIHEDQYIESVRVDFNEINETRDFVKNGDLESGAEQWDANNETDINYQWLSDGPGDRECIGVNISGLKSEKYSTPMRDGYGVENFTNLEGWNFKTNQTSNYFRKKHYHSKPALDGTGSLMVTYNGSSGNDAFCNNSYEFYFNASYPLKSTNLSFYYRTLVEGYPFFGNELEIGVYLENSGKSNLLWKDTFEEGTNNEFLFCSIIDLETKLNKSGYYNLTFYSKHFHLSTYNTTAWFDYIKLNITQGVNKIEKSETVTWNTSLRYNIDIYENATLNFSYYITEKFNNINKSEIYLISMVNNHVFKVNPLNEIQNITWITKSITINKELIDKKDINLSLGLYFNATSYIFQNESFAVFFDNISLVASNHPPPDLINLQIYEKSINNTFTVTGTQHNESYVVISEPDFIWEAGEIIQLNFTGNSSSVRFDCTISYTLYEIVQDEGDNDKSDEEEKEYINTIYLFFTLLLIITISTAIFLIRYQKRSFISPKYDYIKKLRVRKKDLLRTEASKEGSSKKICSTCGKPINYRAKFCEHCGSPQ